MSAARQARPSGEISTVATSPRRSSDRSIPVARRPCVVTTTSSTIKPDAASEVGGVGGCESTRSSQVLPSGEYQIVPRLPMLPIATVPAVLLAILVTVVRGCPAYGSTRPAARPLVLRSAEQVLVAVAERAQRGGEADQRDHEKADGRDTGDVLR